MQAHKPTANGRAFDLTFTPEAASALDAQKRQREVWLEENREAIGTYNELVARDGVFSTSLRGF